MTDQPPRGITVAQLQRLCSRWPGVTRDIKWGDNLVFSVGGKMFAMTHADGREACAEVLSCNWIHSRTPSWDVGIVFG